MLNQPETVFDTVAYIMNRYKDMPESYGTLTAMKLQKLVYYSQAWSLVWDGNPLFHDRIEAWIYGPVVRKIFNISKGEYLPRKIDRNLGNPRKLTRDQRETVDIIVRDYGKYEPEILVSLTHREDPWRKARDRHNLRPDVRGHAIIRHSDMLEYYSGLNQNNDC